MKILTLSAIALSALMVGCGGSGSGGNGPSSSSSSQSSGVVVETSSSSVSSEIITPSSSSNSSEEVVASSSSVSSTEVVVESSSSVSSEIVIASSSSNSSEAPGNTDVLWNLYNGLYHPGVAGSVALSDGNLSQFIVTGTGDYFAAQGDGTVLLDTSAAGANTSGAMITNVVNNSGVYPKYLTLIAGITGNNDNLRVLELEVALADAGVAGSRLKAILRNDGTNKGVQLESANSGASANSYGVADMDKFAIYHFSITLTSATSGSVNVFRNGVAMPNLSLNNVTMRAASAVGDNFLRFGEVSGSATYKSSVDWLVWTSDAALDPTAAGQSLPEDADLGCVYGYGNANDSTTCFNAPGSGSGSSSSVGDTGEGAPDSFPPAAIRPAKMEGFADYAGVTGGAGGPVITVTTGTELNAALCGIRSGNRTLPVTIMVNGTINHSNTTAQGCDTLSDVIEIKNTSNVSIIGVGTNALFDEIGIHVRSASNIILQNLHIRNVKKSGTPISNGGDAIGMETNVDRVWIDHNWLEASGGEKAGYDSLLDMKAGVTNVTVSYNLFNDSSRAGLIGSSDSDDKNTNITFHHNWYKNIEQRTPLIRHAKVHVYNNYWSNPSQNYMFHGINSRMNAQALVESNYFYNSNNPLIASDDSSVAGCWKTNNDNTVLPAIYYSRSVGNGALVIPTIVDGQLQSTCEVTVPYAVSMDPAADVPSIVISNAGVGKLDLANSSSSTGTTSSVASSVASSPSSSAVQSSSVTSSVTESSEASSSAASSDGSSEGASSSPSVGTNILLNESFGIDKTNFFSTSYKSLTNYPNVAMYFVAGGNTGINLTNNTITLAGGRFTVGDSRTGTVSVPKGEFDLSRRYRISFDIVSYNPTGNFYVYVDNAGTSANASNSVHAASSLLYQRSGAALAVGRVSIESDVGTPESFFQIRTDSSGNVTIGNLSIEYVE